MLNAELKDRPLTPGEQAERQALDRIAALREPLDARRRAELGAYAEDLTRAITAKLEQLDLNVPVNVTIGRAPHGADLRYGTTPLPGETTAALTTPLPRRSLNHP